uniref:Uncharacterized protein n=1 Tax=Glossina austeni TaxID=7395 RepID=A0A1A9VFX2_GLOAU
MSKGGSLNKNKRLKVLQRPQPCAYSCGAASLQLPLGQKNHLSFNSNKASVILYSCAGGPVQRFKRIQTKTSYGEIGNQVASSQATKYKEHTIRQFPLCFKPLRVELRASFAHKSTEVCGTLSVLFMIQERRSATVVGAGTRAMFYSSE